MEYPEPDPHPRFLLVLTGFAVAACAFAFAMIVLWLIELVGPYWVVGVPLAYIAWLLLGELGRIVVEQIDGDS